MRPVFERGDVVATTVHYAGHEKAHIGKVLEIGRSGGRILVGFNEKRGQDWFVASKLKFVVGVDENGTPVLSDVRPVEEPSKPAPTKAPPSAPRAASPAPAPVIAPPPAAPTAALSSLDALLNAGVDPLEMWVALGRELTGREERAVAAAEAAVRAADAEVSAAEAMLADARAAADRARAALDVARERHANVARRAGGSL